MKKKLHKCNAYILKILFIFLAILFVGSVAAQQRAVSGNVKDENGESLPGVSVFIKGTTIGTITNFDGNYNLELPDNNADLAALNQNVVMVFQHLGYKTHEEPLGSKRTLNVALFPDTKLLDEVVIVGYGEVLKKDLTGSVVSIKPSEGTAAQYSSVDALLRGRAAGVQVTQGSGSPGGVMSVKIRGVNSLRGNNEPLYVIDGMIMGDSGIDTRDVFGGGSGASNQESQSTLSGISPQDIASIEILKDASATAIYGSRGANGVILITTKQGKPGRPQVTLSVNTEIAEVSKRMDMLDGPSYVAYQNELANLNNQPAVYDPDTLEYINWQDDLQQLAVVQNYRLSMSGSSEDNKSKYYAAGGYIDARGVIKNSGLSKSDFKLNLDQELSSKVNVKFKVIGDFSTTNSTNATERLGAGNNSAINQMLVAKPILNDLPEVLDDEEEAPNNPRVWIEDYDDIGTMQRIVGGLDVDYKMSKTFTYQLRLSANYLEKERTKWQGKTTNPGKKANGALGLSQLQRKYYLVENLLFFRHIIKKRGRVNDRINGTLGVTYDTELVTSSSVLSTNFFTGALRSEGFGFGETLEPYERNKTQSDIFSVLARLNYSLSNKFVFTLSGRADGSSKFAPGNKFSYFPSAAIAYRLINENFMKSLTAFSEFKIRAGYGKSGNQAIGPYATLSRYGKQRYADDGSSVIIGTTPSNIANPKLKWETTSQFNGGIDVGFFENRLTATVDVYHKKTEDLLQTLLLPQSTGFRSIVVNRGSLENRGLEISLNALIIDKAHVGWSITPNISFNRNKLLDLGLPKGVFGTMEGVGYLGGAISTGAYFKDPANIFLEGKPIGLFYGYATDGIYQNTDETQGIVGTDGKPVQPGDVRVVDQDGDGKITETDKVLIGNPNPKFSFGLSTSVAYKRLSLDLFFSGVYGNDVVNGNSIRLNNLSSTYNVLAEAYHTAWTEDNPTNNPRVGYDNLDFIDRYVEDGSFLRLSTARIGYDVPIKGRSFIKQVNLSVTGNNLFVITNYSGFDPEVNSFTFDSSRIGVDWNAYPRTRGVTFGLNIKF